MEKKIFTNEEKRVAELLHLDCTWNHTDGCGWYHGEFQRLYNFERAAKFLVDFKRLGGELKQLEIMAQARHENAYKKANDYPKL